MTGVVKPLCSLMAMSRYPVSRYSVCRSNSTC